MATIVIAVLIILMVVTALGLFGVLPISQAGINKLFYVILAILIAMYALGSYGVHLR